MFRGHHVIESGGAGVVRSIKWDIGGEADLPQLYADDGRCREREVESEKREEGPLKGGVYHAGTRSMIFAANL